MNKSNTYIEWPRWLKLKQAATWASVGKNRLKQLAMDGHIIGFQDPDSKRGDWIFDRYSLDEYRNDQAGYLEEKALALLKAR